MAREVDYIEVHWWINDSTQKPYVRGTDKITREHLNKDLKSVIVDEPIKELTLEDFQDIVNEVGSVGWTPEGSSCAFFNFNGTIHNIVGEPIDFGINKIKKIYKSKV